MFGTDAGRDATGGPTWPSAAHHEVDGVGDSLRRADSVGGGGELFGAGSAGECDPCKDDADHESADVGTGDSGGVAVFGEGGKWLRRDVFEGFATGGEFGGVEWSESDMDWSEELGAVPK